jgi:uncharacterized membrane protein YfcA
MEAFWGIPDISAPMFAVLCFASFVTAIMAVVLGAGGGVMLLILMAFFFPPSLLVPLHTMVQLGVMGGRATLMHKDIMRPCLLPFVLGAGLGAFLGGRLFVSLSAVALQTIIGVLVICIIWAPHIGKVGNLRGRFAAVGFAATFLGVFVSVTGIFIAPFVASAAEDRRSHVATMAGLATLSHILKMIAFSAFGLSIASYWPLVLMMISCGVLGNYVGSQLLNKMSESKFRLIFKIFMTILALRLIFKGLLF